MEFVREYVNAESLMSIITLPETFRNRRLEVIVIPAEESVDEVQQTRKTGRVRAAVKALTGALPNEGLSLAEYRNERLKKYEAFD